MIVLGLAILAAMAATISNAATVSFDVPPFAPFNGTNPPPAWNDTDGHHINAVSPGVFKGGGADGNFYLVGLAVAASNNQQSDYYFSAGLNCYSSPDLRNWTRQNAGNVLVPTNAAVEYTSGAVLGSTRFVFRTHVAFNTSTRKYVMWGKSSESPAWSNQTYFRATADAPCGPYALVTSSANLPPPGYFDDGNLYVDPNSTETPKAAYVVYAGGSLDRETHIVRLDSTYLAAASPLASVTLSRAFSCSGVSCDDTSITPMEAHAIFYRSPNYYLVASDITGWAPNDNYYLTASSMLGPWQRSSTGATRYLSPLDTDTCHAQSGEIIGPVGAGNTYVAFFDRWFDGTRGNSDPPFASPAPLMSHSRLIVQPLSFDGSGNASMACVTTWTLDVGASGTPTPTSPPTSTPPTSTPTPAPTATPTPRATSTATPDTTPPAISYVSSGTPGPTVATITWSTDEPSSSQVEYGHTPGYGSSTTLNSAMVTSHSVALNGLTPGRTYFFRVRSIDAAGNVGTATGSFRTAQPP
ncbi:MAG TPA: fibronectin type III domain-containing protein [Chloroflexota bacterium]